MSPFWIRVTPLWSHGPAHLNCACQVLTVPFLCRFVCLLYCLSCGIAVTFFVCSCVPLLCLPLPCFLGLSRCRCLVLCCRGFVFWSPRCRFPPCLVVAPLFSWLCALSPRPPPFFADYWGAACGSVGPSRWCVALGIWLCIATARVSGWLALFLSAPWVCLPLH